MKQSGLVQVSPARRGITMNTIMIELMTHDPRSRDRRDGL